MDTLKKITFTLLTAAFVLTLSACSPEVGSDQWCSDMKAKPKADWTANQTADFAKNCVFK
jgi:uncharacterized lipoprotein